MDRTEATGFGVAAAGHLALLGALSLGFANAVRPPIMNQPMEVSFVEEIGLQAATPEPSLEAPAPSAAPETGMPEEAAPEPVPAPPEPKPAAKAVDKPVPKPALKPAEKPAPAKPVAKAAAKPVPKKRAVPGAGTAEASRGSRLGEDFLKGLGSEPSPSQSQQAAGAVMSAQAAMSIGAAIARQVQPCADRQVNPGPGANRIKTKINLRLNPDGSLKARPRVLGQSGVDDENRRYAERVADLAIASFVGCAPLRDLPEDLYAVKNGWSNFTMNYKLPG